MSAEQSSNEVNPDDLARLEGEGGQVAARRIVPTQVETVPALDDLEAARMEDEGGPPLPDHGDSYSQAA